MKICPLEAEFFHADGKTDMTNLTVVFLNFANATKMTNTVITLVPTFKTIRHVFGHSLVRVITSYTHTTLNWTLRICQRKRKRGQNEGKVFEPQAGGRLLESFLGFPWFRQTNIWILP
jgi:hypothetical protein